MTTDLTRTVDAQIVKDADKPEPTEVASSVTDPYSGLAASPFSSTAQAVLRAQLRDDEIEIRPDDGMIYLPGVRYRERLAEAFGVGGWGIRPKGEPKVNGTQVFYTGQLVILGRFVSEAMGEGKWIANNPKSSYGTALESAKTDCLTRCCKDLGIASKLWDPTFSRRWRAKWAVRVPNPDPDRFGRSQEVWIRRDDDCAPDNVRPIDHPDGEADRAMFQSAMAEDSGQSHGAGQETGSSGNRHAHALDGQMAMPGKGLNPGAFQDSAASEVNGGSATAHPVPQYPSAPSPVRREPGDYSKPKVDYVPGNQVPPKLTDPMVTQSQLARIHILLKEIGWPEDLYRKALAAYKRLIGETSDIKPVEHSNELREPQAANLIRRMEAQKSRNANRLAHMEAESPIMSHAEPDPVVQLMEERLQRSIDSFLTDADLAILLDEIGSTAREQLDEIGERERNRSWTKRHQKAIAEAIAAKFV